MNIEEIYIQIFNNDDDSIIELAKKEVMVIPILVNTMLDNADNRAEKILIQLSEQSPILVYQYFTYISQMADRYNNSAAWNMWKIIANVLIVDLFDLWEYVKPKYFNSFKSEIITEVLISISTAKTIIKYKPNDKDIIIEAIKDCVNNNYKICGEAAPHIKAVAENAVKEFFEDF